MSESRSLLREMVELVLEVRHKEIYGQLVKKYANLPRYVLHDLYRGTDMPLLQQLNNLTWKKIVIEVNPGDFDTETQAKFAQREFGAVNPGNWYVRDAERMETQKKLAAERPQGGNEPIVVVKRVDGKYKLIEGWHRTMSILQMGKNGGPPEGWEPVRINAWVGSK